MSGPYLVWSGCTDWGGRWAKTREDFDEFAERVSGDYVGGRLAITEFEAQLEGCRAQVVEMLGRSEC